MKLFLLAVFAVMSVSMPLAAGSKLAPTLSVEIASPARLGKRTLDLNSVAVVVANRSTKEVRVWREWCSWGWFQLSFEVRIDDDRVVLVRKKERGWDKNFPDFWTLAPGEPLVLTANLLDAEAWKWSSPAARLRGKTMEVRAVFMSADDDEAEEMGAFHGEILSPWRKYELR